MQLEKTANILNSYEGRDKLSKILQFSSRLIQWYYTNKLGQIEKGKNYGNLSKSFLDARKLFSLLKSFNELEKFISILSKCNLNNVKYL